MAYYIFDENTFDSFDAARLVIEEGKKDIGTYKVSYFNLRYKNDDGSACQIKIKTPVLTTPFGVMKNQFGKTQLTVNVPNNNLHRFLTVLQNALKAYICNNIKSFNKASTKQKISEDEFDILSTAFDIIKPHKEDTNFDDTIIFDLTSEFDQRNTKIFDSTKTLIENISYQEDADESTYVSNVIPAHSQIRLVFKINSICMYGESRARKFTIKKNPVQILVVERPASNNTCEFSDEDVTDEEQSEGGNSEDANWDD